MRCPKCKKMMNKIIDNPYLNNGVYFYECKSCNYITDLMIDNNKPFGEKFKLSYDKDSDLETWNEKKKYVVEDMLKKEHKKIVKNMEKKYGVNITKNDITDFLIDLYLHNKRIEENNKKVKKTLVIKKKKLKKTPKKKEKK